MSRLRLLLFTTDTDFARHAERAGVDGFIVDWENHSKALRQQGYGTEINFDTVEDARALCGCVRSPVTVRIDRTSDFMTRHIEEAIECGARSLMLPMAEDASDVEAFVDLVDGRAETIVQIETESLVTRCHDLRSIGWDCVYVGLNDLMISRRAQWYWEPFFDGTMERIVETLEGRSVGLGGVTVIGGGSPLPFTDLLREMARLGCSTSFLRRTFKKEIVGRDLDLELAAVRAFWDAACARTPEAVDIDHRAFLQTISSPRCRPLLAYS
jgi:hypothetical protein